MAEREQPSGVEARLTRLVENLRRELGVDAGLDDTVATVAGRTVLTDQVAEANRGLRRRIRALSAAGEHVKRAIEDLDRLATIGWFLDEGWPERRTQLAGELARDEASGVSMWFDDVGWALGHAYLEAVERLTSDDVAVPSILRSRVRLAGRAIGSGSDVERARPVLTALAEGMTIAGSGAPTRSAPQVATRAALSILLARAAVIAGTDPTADLARAEAAGAAPSAVAAVHAMAARRQDAASRGAVTPADDDDLVAAVGGDGGPPPGDEARAGADAGSGDPEPGAAEPADMLRADDADLGAAVEAVWVAQGRDAGEALEAATEAVDTRASLVGIEHELDSLLEPPPLAVWLALADRARVEGDVALVEVATQRADDHVAVDDWGSRGLISDLRVRLAADGEPGERAALLIQAADQHLWAGNSDGAIDRYAQALELTPDSTEAKVSLADAILFRWSDKPLRESAGQVRRGLRLITEAHETAGGLRDWPWSLIDESALHLTLSRASSPERVPHLWSALLAASRAVLHGWDEARYWAPLSRVGEAVGLYQTTAFAATRIEQLASSDADLMAAREEVVKSAANRGEFDVALDRLGRPVTPWDFALHGFILLRTGEAGEAIPALRRGVLTGWSRQALVHALLAVGRRVDAEEQARLMCDESRDQIDEVDGLYATATAELVLRNYAEAEALGRRCMAVLPEAVAEGFGQAIVGTARLLSGEADGLALLIDATARALSPRDLGDWSSVELPMLLALADEAGQRLPDLGPVAAARQSRHAALVALQDPAKEIDAIRRSTRDDPSADAALALTAAVVHAARDELDLAAAAVAGVELVRQLPDWPLLAARLDIVTGPGWPAPTGTPSADPSGDPSEGPSGPADGDVEPDPVDEAGDEDDADLSDADADADADEPTAVPIRLLVPTSWFAEYSGRETEHEIFTRLLPAMRQLADWEFPSINVSIEDELEPGGYRVEIGDAPMERGDLSMDVRYGEGWVAEPLGIEAAGPGPDGLVAYAIDGAALTPLAELLTASPVEVAVERLRANIEALRPLLDDDI